MPDVCFPNVKVRHHVCRWSAGSPDGDTQQDLQGGGEAHYSLPCGDNLLQHYVQGRSLQACSLCGLQRGQQPGQRKVYLMLLVDAVRCADWFQVGAARSDCHVDRGGGAGHVGFGHEGSNVRLEHAD